MRVRDWIPLTAGCTGGLLAHVDLRLLTGERTEIVMESGGDESGLRANENWTQDRKWADT